MTNKHIIIIVVVLVIAVSFIWGYSYYLQQQAFLAKIVPDAPSDLTGNPTSATEINLVWTDNSNNENGFSVYRDGVLIESLDKDQEQYLDSSLRPATVYKYEVKAINLAGQSQPALCMAKTSNPPINIWIEQIGVHNDGDEGEIRALFEIFAHEGEIYVPMIVYNGDIRIKCQLPEPYGAFKTDDVYHLKHDQSIPVNIKAFSINEASDNLTLVIVGMEKDAGGGEKLVYSLLDTAFKRSMGNPISLILMLEGVDFSGVFADIAGGEDDYMGKYAASWSAKDNWGVGDYNDIKCYMKNGDIGLRIWLRVECPVYDYSKEKVQK